MGRWPEVQVQVRLRDMVGMFECPVCGGEIFLDEDPEVTGRWFYTCQNRDCFDNGIAGEGIEVRW